MNRPLLAEDIQHVLCHARPALANLRNARLFITGGTGFFGKWLLETFAHANREFSLGAKAVVLSRHPARFLDQMPHLSRETSIEFVQGDVTTFTFPHGSFEWIIHAATEASTTLNNENPLAMLDTTIAGTRRVLELARACHCAGMLLTSSGAVYGSQPSDLTHIPEGYRGAPDSLDPKAAYANGKRMAEHLCCLYHEKYQIPVRIARCFAFVGPHLPLNAHFAIGNFIRDALAQAPIRVNGDGTPYRSYLYSADLAVWLWTILLKGKSCVPYNVGSDDAITIANLARKIAALGNSAVTIAHEPKPGALPQRYVAAVQKARTELGLDVSIDLDNAIARTVRWHRVEA